MGERGEEGKAVLRIVQEDFPCRGHEGQRKEPLVQVLLEKVWASSSQ
jgi:hypothetical protein